MKTSHALFPPISLRFYFLFIALFSFSLLHATVYQELETIAYKSFKGKVTDAVSRKPLVFASLTIHNSNISTLTNSEGKFVLKVPLQLMGEKLTISMMGYQTQTLQLKDLKSKKNDIRLKPSVVKLPEVVFNVPQSATALVRAIFKNKKQKYFTKPMIMTAFYRESIKKRKRNVSLAEAVVRIYKAPYHSPKRDKISLYKSRKSTDYSRLDTVALKLQGGPYNALSTDVIKYPDYVFSDLSFNDYNFVFKPSQYIHDRLIFVVSFKAKSTVKKPMYFGELYIDSQTLALVSAHYKLDVTDKEKSAKLFVKKKPKDVLVYPTDVSYQVDYKQDDKSWYFSYGRAQLRFKVKKKSKWFSASYTLNSEMAVTDWHTNTTREKPKDKIRPAIIIVDEASGFSDPEFWGSYNIIEPEKPIQSAIKKIKKRLMQ